VKRSLILLFDGTANDSSHVLDTEKFTNVYGINQLIAPVVKTNNRVTKVQICFYMPGVGTKFTVKTHGKWRLLDFFMRTTQALFGDDLEQIVLRAYINICANYQLGDDIALIGFSRGAAAARIFSRMISDFGILKPEYLIHLDDIWGRFVEISRIQHDTQYESEVKKLKMELEDRNHEDVFQPVLKQKLISFLGVFDTVIGPNDDQLLTNLDFRDFKPAKHVNKILHLMSLNDVRAHFKLKRFDIPSRIEMLREIWMPGVHSDIGGGYRSDLISTVALLTMATIMRDEGGIVLNENAMKYRIGLAAKMYREEYFVINKEPHIAFKLPRNMLVASEDEIHPLHYDLIDTAVEWKGEGRTAYIDKFDGRPHTANPMLTKEYDKWFKASLYQKIFSGNNMY
jgi:uncharacterized protein (DUF2235 family)